MLLLPPVDFPTLIRKIEKQRGMNRNAIARQLHVSPSAVCRWLTGEHEPSYRNGTALVCLAGADSATSDPGDSNTAPQRAR